MVIGIALVDDILTQNIIRRISFEGRVTWGIDNESINMVPHISLKQSFQYGGDIRALETWFDGFFAGVQPFRIRFGGVNMIEKNRDTGILWFDVVEDSLLRKMHNDLCTGLHEAFGIEPSGFDGPDWHFHSTIIYSKTGINRLEELFVKYKDCYRDLSSTVNEAIMFCQLGDETALKEIFVYKLFPLGRACEVP